MKRGGNLIILLLVVIFFQSILIIRLLQAPETVLPLSLGNTSIVSELSTRRYVLVKPDAQVVGNIGFVILKSSCYQISGQTDAWIAQSILNGMENKSGFRPDAHDVFRDTLNLFGIRVLMTKVVDIKENTFIGRLILQQGNKIISLDIRPSNGVAVAVRTGAPIYVKEDLMKEYGQNIC